MTFCAWILAGLAHDTRGQGPESLDTVGVPPVMICSWIDPYDSTPYMAMMDPGMAVIAAPASRMTLGLQVENKGDPRGVEILGISTASTFGRRNGRVAARPKPAEYVLDLPDTGGAYPVTLQYRRSANGQQPAVTGGIPLTILIPKPMRIVRGRINGYVTGSYPERGDDRKIPDRFVEITPDLMDLYLSKQFRIRDFVSNSRTEAQRRYFPKYAVIRYSLISKVERLVSIIDRQPNFECKGIRVLSGFRTPDYNRILPEAAFHSYHQYGLAVDLIVDSAPSDGAFDDVNMDGKVNIKDAASLAKICDLLETRGSLPHGGIGLYEYRHSLPGGKWRSTYHVHVDVRESKQTRWGYAFKDGRKFARLIWN